MDRSSSSAPRHLIGSLNTRRIGTKHHVRLAKGPQGFGIKIAERDNMFGNNRPIYITAITTTGLAYRDGRLKEGDMILEVKSQSKTAKTQPEVIKMLKELPVSESVEFVVSRQEDTKTSQDQSTNGQDYVNIKTNDDVKSNHKSNGERSHKHNKDKEKSLIDLDASDTGESVIDQLSNKKLEERIDSLFNLDAVDGPGIHVYDIPTNDTRSAGLGLYLKYPSISGKDLGIYIKKVITGGAAWKDRRLQPGDQILAVNGVDLVNLSNDDASRVLNTVVWQGIGPDAQPNMIRLTIHRRNPKDTQSVTEPTSGIHSCDENSSGPEAREDQFQRGGFGRQSISEKRHAQLAAKNTDTFKRNQKLREERERQRQIEERLAKQHINEPKPPKVIDQNGSIHSASPSLQYPPRNISNTSIPKIQPIYGTNSSMLNYQFNSMRAAVPPKPEMVNHHPTYQQTNILPERFMYVPQGQPYMNDLMASANVVQPSFPPARPPVPMRQPEQFLNRSGMLDLSGRCASHSFPNGHWNSVWTGVRPNNYYGSNATADYNRNIPTYPYLSGHNLPTSNFQPLTASHRMVPPQPPYINQTYQQSQPHQQPRVYYIYYV